jgi:hypothetical protein
MPYPFEQRDERKIQKKQPKVKPDRAGKKHKETMGAENFERKNKKHGQAEKHAERLYVKTRAAVFFQNSEESVQRVHQQKHRAEQKQSAGVEIQKKAHQKSEKKPALHRIAEPVIKNRNKRQNAERIKTRLGQIPQYYGRDEREKLAQYIIHFCPNQNLLFAKGGKIIRICRLCQKTKL